MAKRGKRSGQGAGTTTVVQDAPLLINNLAQRLFCKVELRSLLESEIPLNGVRVSIGGAIGVITSYGFYESGDASVGLHLDVDYEYPNGRIYTTDTKAPLLMDAARVLDVLPNNAEVLKAVRTYLFNTVKEHPRQSIQRLAALTGVSLDLLEKIVKDFLERGTVRSSTGTVNGLLYVYTPNPVYY